MTKRTLAVIAFIYSLILVLSSCKKDEFETGDVKLEFSEDTIIFDTVFTTVGSATELFTVYNRGDKDVKLSSIRLAKGTSSDFRLNVDGVPGKSFNDVQIGANDSIFIFVEVTVDPNNANTPMIVTDSVIFNANNFQSDVDLVAWGQDAYFHRASPTSQIFPFFILNCNETWSNDKPHVVYGYAMVDSGCTLTVNEGTNVYFHPGSGLLVLNSASLIVNGTMQNKVTFQGDRLGEDFKDVPGQWDRIWLSNLNIHSNINSPGTKNSTIKNAIIKNGTIGLLVDTAFDNDPTHLTLEMENTIVKNMSSNGIALRGSRVNAFNCVFANCGAQTANILYGGQYNFYHCTFANFWENGQRQDASVSLNNYFVADNTLFVRKLNANFYNSIIYGNNDTELALDSASAGNQFGFLFDHALLKLESTFPTGDASRYKFVIRAANESNDPKFADVANNFYQLDTNSIVIDSGDIAPVFDFPTILNKDILGINRPQRTAPDLGAYERE